MKRLQFLSLFVLALMLAGAIGVLSPGTAIGTTVPPTPTPNSSDDGGESDGEIAPELPAPDLPSGSAEGYTFNVKYINSISDDLEGLPREASVYQLLREEPTEKSVSQIADKVGITGDIKDRGDGTFEAEGNGKLFVSIDQTVYTSEADAGDGDLPSDEKAIADARDWLRKTGLLPPDIGDGYILERLDDSHRVIVGFSPIEPTPILSGYPSISVTVGSNSEVLEAQIRWANIVRADVYQLLTPDQAWQTVASGQAFLNTDLSGANIEPGSDVTGDVRFSSVSIAYASAGPPGGVQYLEPIYVFEGRIRPEGSDKTYPITAYVSALSNSGAPVG